MAAETGDKACVPGAIIPVLALGIPGSAPSAVLMAAMIIHGVQPGPMMMIEHPHFVYEVVAMTMLATIGILIFGLFADQAAAHGAEGPAPVLMPIIFVLCTVGSFAIASRLFDVWVMLAIGIGAFFLRRRGYPDGAAGAGHGARRLLDKSLRRGLVLSDGSLAPFFTRPISLGLRDRDDLRDPALRSGVQGGWSTRHRRPPAGGSGRCARRRPSGGDAA